MSSLSLPSGAFRSTSFSTRVLKQWMPAVQRRVQEAWLAFSAPAPGAPTSVSELLDLASTYEKTQPSYAADLRAAALQYEGAKLAREAKF